MDHKVAHFNATISPTRNPKEKLITIASAVVSSEFLSKSFNAYSLILCSSSSLNTSYSGSLSSIGVNSEALILKLEYGLLLNSPNSTK